MRSRSCRRPDADRRGTLRGRLAAGAALLAVMLLGALPAQAAHAAHAAHAAPDAGTPGTAGPATQDRDRDAATQDRDAGPAAGQVAVRGGDSLYAAGRVCTVGFNATNGGTDYAIVSGRCVTGADTWYADPAMTVPVGSTAGSSFPGNDYGLIRYTNPDVARPGEVETGAGGPVDITRSASPAVGQSMCHAGRVSGLQCGTVQAVNVSVNYPEGTVSGLFRSTAHSEPGDEGGPAFSGGTALGFIVGAGSGSTFYQPVGEVLAAYGLALS
ncbi:S1 family peptidase [Streptomyces sp. WMMB 322]|uniref:S1 family peptidase n=1 Tax=Streptomyces sp. WMMB 322 TaxID=1286821 RepID=UPI0006E44299|nr:S1 family peptidase [Streptomyces sp. WMMB 322]SCK37627.1 streptogrisin B [Streptomyces sp. WMMB 322]